MIELRFPEPAIALDPLQRSAHRRGRQRGAPDTALTLDRRETRTLEHAHMLRHGWQRHVEPRRELADRPVASRESREDLPPRRISECSERAIEQLGMVNHTV